MEVAKQVLGLMYEHRSGPGWVRAQGLTGPGVQRRRECPLLLGMVGMIRLCLGVGAIRVHRVLRVLMFLATLVFLGALACLGGLGGLGGACGSPFRCPPLSARSLPGG